MITDYGYGNQCLSESYDLEAVPSDSGRYYLPDVAAEMGQSVATLGFFAYEHLGSDDYDLEDDTLSEEGYLMIHMWMGDN